MWTVPAATVTVVFASPAPAVTETVTVPGVTALYDVTVANARLLARTVEP